MEITLPKRSVINYRSAFFNLELKEQNKLRLYMAFISFVSIIQFLVLSGFLTSIFNLLFTARSTLSNNVFNILGIAFGVFILYFSFSIAKAPTLYFRIIPISIWPTLVFDTLGLFSNLALQAYFENNNVFSVIRIAAVLFYIKTIIKYRNSVKTNKRGLVVGWIFVGIVIIYSLILPHLLRNMTKDHNMQVKNITGIVLPEIEGFASQKKPFHKDGQTNYYLTNYSNRNTIALFFTKYVQFKNIDEVAEQYKSWETQIIESSPEVIPLNNGNTLRFESILFGNKQFGYQQNIQKGIQYSTRLKDNNCLIIIYTDINNEFDKTNSIQIIKSILELNK